MYGKIQKFGIHLLYESQSENNQTSEFFKTYGLQFKKIH
jgi:hypothetical protein